MRTAMNHRDISAVDALWVLYRQQPRTVRDAFRERLARGESEEPRSLTTEEAKAEVLQRGRDIMAGRERLIPHDAVMQEMEQMLTAYAD